MARVFVDDTPNPKEKNHQRKRRRIAEKGRKANQTELNWAAKYDAAKDAEPAAASPPPEPAAAPPQVVVPAVEDMSTTTTITSSAPIPAAQAVAASSAKPMPVPALAPTSAPGAKVVPPSTSPPRSSPNPPPAAGAAAPSEDAFPQASLAVQAQRAASLRMIWKLVAEGLTDLQRKVETTMRGEKWALPITFWETEWLDLAVNVSNRYLPDSVSGLVVEGSTIVLPPVLLFRSASKLEKAGYELGVEGTPGQPSKPLSGATKPPEVVKPPDPMPAPTPSANGVKAVASPARARGDSTGNAPAKRDTSPINVRDAFGS